MATCKLVSECFDVDAWRFDAIKPRTNVKTFTYMACLGLHAGDAAVRGAFCVHAKAVPGKWMF